MIQILEPMLNEFREETITTRRVLERVPGDRMSWKPHPKSMSRGQLALRVASVPGGLANLARLDEFEASQANFEPPLLAIWMRFSLPSTQVSNPRNRA